MCPILEIPTQQLKTLSPSEIKSLVNTRSVIGRYVNLNNKGMGLCPFHKDTNNSFVLYENSQNYHCFGCGANGDVITFTMEFHNLEFSNALEWLKQDSFNFDMGGVKPVPFKQSSYKGPVDIRAILTWHDNLKDRKWLYTRMLTDTTIDANKIGWSSHKKAHIFPYWSGIPGHSSVDVAQLRYEETGQYMGLKGHYRKAILNKHILEKSDWVIILMGTMDALLAAQDGLPAVSINGSNMFNKEWLPLFTSKKRVVVTPDKNNEHELDAALKIVEDIGGNAYVQELPSHSPGKDYSDMRMGGWGIEEAKAIFREESIF